MSSTTKHFKVYLYIPEVSFRSYQYIDTSTQINGHIWHYLITFLWRRAVGLSHRHDLCCYAICA